MLLIIDCKRQVNSKKTDLKNGSVPTNGTKAVPDGKDSVKIIEKSEMLNDVQVSNSFIEKLHCQMNTLFAMNDALRRVKIFC